MSTAHEPPSKIPKVKSGLPATAETQEGHSLAALVELSKELSTPLDLYGLADIGMMHLMGSLGIRSAALWVLPHGPGKPLVLLRTFGIADKVGRIVGSMCQPELLQRFSNSTTPLFVEDLAKQLASPDLSLLRRHGIALFAGVCAREGLMGVIALGERSGGRPLETYQIRVLEASLYHLGVALENSILYSSLHENNRLLRHAKQDLEDHDALQREFLSNLDHELRTPLTVMLSYLDIIFDQVEPGSELGEQIGVVIEQGSKLKAMIMGLLDFTSLDKGELSFQLEETNVVEAVQRCVADRRPGVSRGFRELIFTSRAQHLAAAVDTERLAQILDALVDNAEKFTAEGTRIDVRVDDVRAEGQAWVRIRIMDDGPGIPPDKLDRIFQLFRQVDGSMTRSVGGMGMGLPLARALVEKMGGQLEVASELGRGTTCIILVPRLGVPADTTPGPILVE